MKKVLLTLLVLFSFGIVSYSQTDSLYRVKLVDEMGGNTYIMTNRNVVFANENKTMGFRLDFMFNDEGIADNLMVKPVGIGNCQENSTLIILLENGERFTFTMWNKFNCKDKVYFKYTEDDKELITKSPIKKIRFTNGYSYEELTVDVSEKNKNIFIQINEDKSIHKTIVQ